MRSLASRSLASIGRLTAVSALALVASCGGGTPSGDGGGADEFVFKMVTEPSISVTVTRADTGAPLPGARVLVTTPLSDASAYTASDEEDASTDVAEGFDGATWFQGLTDSRGTVSGTGRIPTSQTQVDIVVQKAGFTGTYTVEDLRTAWGVTAPSARITRAVTALAGVTVELEAE